jgi:uncharacterized protein YbbC (DUF1343 family)
MEMEKYEHQVQTGLDVLINEKLEIIKGKKIGLVTNHTGVDRSGKPNFEILMKLSDVDLKAIFAPEHGFYGNVSRGQIVDDQGQDGLPVIYSLYGKTQKPTLEMFDSLDLIIYDIQDVGARFYTYISTMGLVMEAAGEAKIPIIILDRPNPLGGKNSDGPIMLQQYTSFVGMYPIPIKYGLTPGELATMIIGEKWIGTIPELTVVEMEGWKRNMLFFDTGLPWVQPSPNIPDIETAIRYPGLCLVEGTNVSEGRGTYHPFKYIGAPWINAQQLTVIMNNLNLTGVIFESVSFTPVSIPGRSENPKYKNKECFGVHVIITDKLKYRPVQTGVQLIRTIKKLYPEEFEWNDFIYKLWGIDSLLEYDSRDDGFKQLAKKYYLYD